LATLIKGDMFADAYVQLLGKLANHPEFTNTAPRGLKIKEISNVILEIEDSTVNMFDNQIRGIDHKYLAGELLWYFSGRNDIDFIRRYSKFWENITNEDGTLNSAYGYQLWGIKNKHGFTEWDWAVESLKKDCDSRQAIIRFNKPDVSFLGNKDFVCTLTGTFQIRNSKLNLEINMRSSDAILGLTYDVPFFSLLVQAMVSELKETYPIIEAGSLTMMLNSSHIYERHFDLVDDMLKHEFVDYSLPMYDKKLIGLNVGDILVSTEDDLAHWIANHC
jgi:thymidylate synthase